MNKIELKNKTHEIYNRIERCEDEFDAHFNAVIAYALKKHGKSKLAMAIVKLETELYEN